MQDDQWTSDSDAEPVNQGDVAAAKPSQSQSPEAEVKHLRKELKRLNERLASSQRDLEDYRKMVMNSFASSTLDGTSIAEIRTEELPPAPPRDDDTHYFESYNDNGMYRCIAPVINLLIVFLGCTAIHWTMLTDKVRTSTYATFIASNPALFRNAVVMDVGCGTGILSLFAARAGAKRVLAVEASQIADKAEAIFKKSEFADVIT
jgi:type I protein arginine methyltransferase